MNAPKRRPAVKAKPKTKKKEGSDYILRLYVAGMSVKSLNAIERIRKICQSHLKNHYILEIIDIYQNPIFAKNGQIIAAPTLIKELPLPLKKFIGDMSDTGKLLLGLDLESKNKRG
jgi:circadian clock protein KaiB